jgi:hypothetical protein
VAGSGETLHNDVTPPLPQGVLLKHVKVVDGAFSEMTAGEQVVVDATKITQDTVDSVGALKLARVYANVAALPITPHEDWMVVGVTRTATTRPGVAISVGGAWRILDTTE